MKKRNLFALILCLAMIFGLAACGGSGNTSSGANSGAVSSGTVSSGEDSSGDAAVSTPATTDKTELVVGTDYEPTDMNHYTNATDANKVINAAIYETLFMYNEDNEIVPLLAESYEFGGEDGLELTIKLHEGITFSNGNPLTAEDVLYTMGMNQGNMAVATKFASIDLESSYAADDTTVVLKLSQYDNTLLPYLTGEYGQILDKEYMESVGEDAGLGQTPIGTGPYMFGEWAHGTSITLVKNENYWGDKDKFQNFETIKFMFFSDDSVRSLELEQGNLDIALLNTGDSVSRLSGVDGLTVYSTPLTKVGHFCMATTIEDQTFVDENKRLAIAYALDMEAIVSVIAGDTAIAATSLLPSGVEGYVNHAYPYDPDKAMEYLALAGCPDGFEFTIEVANNQQMNLELATAIQAYLDAVGITMHIDAMDFGAQFGNMLSGKSLCSIMVATCNGDASMGLTAFAPHSGLCISENNDEVFVELMNNCRYEKDPEKRMEYLAELQQYMYDKAYAIPVYEQVFSLGYQSYLQGVESSNIKGELGFYVTRLSFNRG